MGHDNDKIPDPKEIEREIGAFLNKRFGGSVRVVSPVVLPQGASPAKSAGKKPQFDLKPAELVSYLDQYIIRQDRAKAVLATKICTHFNRIKHLEAAKEKIPEIALGVKSNILMAGPTGVGKTYMIKLIAQKLGVPFVKGDATKYSETGYVGRDVEDLIRDLVREAEGDIELASHGIVYIDEIDKIASSRNLIGADISRTGVQRALLKPMEETDVTLKSPQDPVSMMQELERFQRTGQKERRTINTANILFIVSGAFGDITDIIKKRVADQSMGFGAKLVGEAQRQDLLAQLRAEDLVAYGFESEFVGRLPVRTVFEGLGEEDLYAILKNPNNPIILGKKVDFAAYDIAVNVEDEALRLLARRAGGENTGARGLVSAIEEVLLPFETRLPGSGIRHFPVTATAVRQPEEILAAMLEAPESLRWKAVYERILEGERAHVARTIEGDWKQLSLRHGLTLTQPRIALVAAYFCRNITGIDNAIQTVKRYHDEAKKIELYFLDQHDIIVVLEEDAVDFIIEQFIYTKAKFDEVYDKITLDFEHGLKLVRDRTGRNRFLLGREALVSPEPFLDALIRRELGQS